MTQTFKNKDFLVVLALLGAAAAIYFPIVNFDFVYLDDNHYVLINPWIRSFSWENTAAWFTKPFMGSYHGLTLFSYALDYFLYQDHAGGYHFTNLCLHILNTWLVFTVLRLLLEDKALAGLGAVLFALHPAQIESVAWIASRKNLLSGFFVLAAFTVVLDWTRSQEEYSAWRRALLWGLFAATLLSKVTAVVFPAVLWVYAAVFRPVWKRKNPFLSAGMLLPAVLCALIGMLLYPGIAEALKDNIALHLVAEVPAYYGFYLQRTFYPAGLAPFYAVELLGLAGWSGILKWLLAVGLGIAGFFLRHRNKMVVFGVLWFFIWLAPVICAVPVAPADRHLYIAIIGLILALPAGLRTISRRGTLLVMALACLVLLPLQQKRLWLWQNAPALWSEVLKESPADFFANNGMADYHVKRQEFDRAIPYYLALVRHWPLEFYPYFNLTQIYNYQKDEKALRELVALAEARFPNHPETFFLRGIEAYSLKDTKKAEEFFEQARARGSKNSWAYYYAGRFALERKDYEEALRLFEQALTLGAVPEDMLFYSVQALNHLQLFADALLVMKNMNAEQLTDPRLYLEAGYANLMLGNSRQARYYYEKSIAHAPAEPRAYFHMAMIYYVEGDLRGALNFLKQTVLRNPFSRPSREAYRTVYDALQS